MQVDITPCEGGRATGGIPEGGGDSTAHPEANKGGSPPDFERGALPHAHVSTLRWKMNTRRRNCPDVESAWGACPEQEKVAMQYRERAKEYQLKAHFPGVE